jgi:hypothetical protein
MYDMASNILHYWNNCHVKNVYMSDRIFSFFTRSGYYSHTVRPSTLSLPYRSLFVFGDCILLLPWKENLLVSYPFYF